MSTPGQQPLDLTSLPNVVTGETSDIAAMSYQEIMPKLHGLQPGQYVAAADAFHELAEVLETVRAKIASTGDAMAANGSWKGSAAQGAMRNFQQLHDQAATLSVQARQAGDAIGWFGSEATPPFQQLPSPQVMGKSESDALMAAPLNAIMPGGASASAAALGAMGIGPNGQGKADTAAREYMTAYNQQIVKMNNALPTPGSGSQRSSIEAQPWSKPPGNHTVGGGGGSGTGSGYGGVPGSGGPGTGGGSGYPSPAGPNPFAKAHLPGGAGSTGSLQGYTAPPSGTTASPFGAGAPSPTAAGGGAASPFGRMAMLPGGSGFGAGGAASEGRIPREGGVPGEGGLGSGAAGETAAGAEGSAAGAEAAGAAGAEGMPIGGMGGGGGQQDKERQRQAWMEEDTSIWGVPDTDIGPEIG